MTDIVASIGDYAVLPLTIPPQPAFPVQATHYLYIKAHEPRIPSPDSLRSIFVANIPVDSTASHFRALFASEVLGGFRVEDASFDPAKPSKASLKAHGAVGVREAQQRPRNRRKRKRGEYANLTDPEDLVADLPETWDREIHRSGSSAVVTFIDSTSAKGALKALEKAARKSATVTWPSPTNVPALGPARYLAHNNMMYPDKATLQSSVDAFMTSFSQLETVKAKELARKRNVPDEDGFITVTRGGRIGPAREDEAKEVLRKKQEKEKKERDERGDFYRFQVREARKAKEGELKKKFENDRRRIEEMRKDGGKRFRPMG